MSLRDLNYVHDTKQRKSHFHFLGTRIADEIQNRCSYVKDAVLETSMPYDNEHKFNVKTHLCPLEAQNPHILKEFHPGAPCCLEYFQSASGATLETWGPFDLEHQDLVI
jgi:hypothetical protein